MAYFLLCGKTKTAVVEKCQGCTCIASTKATVTVITSAATKREEAQHKKIMDVIRARAESLDW